MIILTLPCRPACFGLGGFAAEGRGMGRKAGLEALWRWAWWKPAVQRDKRSFFALGLGSSGP